MKASFYLGLFNTINGLVHLVLSLVGVSAWQVSVPLGIFLLAVGWINFHEYFRRAFRS